MTTFSKQKILIVGSTQWGNQYAGGAAGVADSERRWMRTLATELTAAIKPTGHEVLQGPLGESYEDNVTWVNKQPGTDFMLSLHSNATAAPADRPTGIGIYHAPKSTKGTALAKSLAPFLAPISPSGKSFVATLTVHELVDTYPPALLIENEFHDWFGSPTAGGSSWIRNPENRARLCAAYVKWIVSEFGSKENAPSADEPAADLTFEFGLAAQQSPRFGGSTNYKARGIALRDLMGCSIYTLTETTRLMRIGIESILGPSYKTEVHSAGTVAVAYDSDLWKLIDTDEVDFGDKYHGAMRVTLASPDGLEVDVIGSHTRPKAVASDTQKRNDIKKALTLVGERPVIFAGDWAMNPDTLCAAKGLFRGSPSEDSYDVPGVQKIDAFYLKKGGRITVESTEMVNPGGISDHRWPKGALVLHASAAAL